MVRKAEQDAASYALYDIFVDNARYKTAGTILEAAGTLLTPAVATNIIRIHQYSISANGTIVYSLNNAAPTGGTLDFGGYLNSGVVASPNPMFVNKPFVPYPGYLCKTSTVGSALCLGTYGIAPVLGTVHFQCVYSEDVP